MLYSPTSSDTHEADSWEPIHGTAWQSTGLSEPQCSFAMWQIAIHRRWQPPKRSCPLWDRGEKNQGLPNAKSFYFALHSKKSSIMSVSAVNAKILSELWCILILEKNLRKLGFSRVVHCLVLIDVTSRGCAMTTRGNGEMACLVDMPYTQ